MLSKLIWTAFGQHFFEIRSNDTELLHAFACAIYGDKKKKGDLLFFTSLPFIRKRIQITSNVQ